MTAELKELTAHALRLSPEERGQLAHQLILSLEEDRKDSPEVIAKAWEEEISRRIAAMESGATRWVSGAEVIARMRAKVNTAMADADQRQR